MTIFYYVACLFSLVACYFSEKKEKGSLFFLSFCLVAFISMFRASSVGIDTKNYIQYFEWIKIGLSVKMEIGFLFFTKICLIFINNPSYVLSLYSFLTITFIYLRFWTLRDNTSITIMCFVFLSLYFQLSMNIMRQFFANALVFFATYYLQKNKIIIYLILLLISTFFHISSLLGLIPLIFFLLFAYKGKNKSFLVCFLCSSVILSSIFIVQLYLNKYDSYLQKNDVNIGLIIPIKIVISYAFYFNNTSKFKKEEKYYYLCYLTGLLLTSFGYFFTYLERIGLLLMLYEPVLLALFCTKGRLKIVAKIYVFGLCFLFIVINYFSNSNGIFPYYFNF